MYGGYIQQHPSSENASSPPVHYDESEALALVKLLEKDDLEKLVNDDTKLNALIKDLNQVCCVWIVYRGYPNWFIILI